MTSDSLEFWKSLIATRLTELENLKGTPLFSRDHRKEMELLLQLKKQYS